MEVSAASVQLTAIEFCHLGKTDSNLYHFDRPGGGGTRDAWPRPQREREEVDGDVYSLGMHSGAS